MHQSIRFGREAIYQGNLEKSMDGRETVMRESIRCGNFLSRYGNKSMIWD